MDILQDSDLINFKITQNDKMSEGIVRGKASNCALPSLGQGYIVELKDNIKIDGYSCITVFDYQIFQCFNSEGEPKNYKNSCANTRCD